MTGVKLMVLYPHPNDQQQFDKDYAEHLAFFREKTNLAAELKPYSVTKFMTTPMGPSPYYQMFTLPFPSVQALQQTMMSPEMLAVAADAQRISTGGAPVILVGSDS